MQDNETLNHTTWECKYHVVFIPKYRRKALYMSCGGISGEVFRALAPQKECRIEEGHLMADHVHMFISIRPRYSVSPVMGYIKGKAAIHIARTFMGSPKELYRPPFLGAGLLCIHRRQRRGGDASIYPARTRRKIAVWIRWTCGKRGRCWLIAEPL